MTAYQQLISAGLLDPHHRNHSYFIRIIDLMTPNRYTSSTAYNNSTNSGSSTISDDSKYISSEAILTLNTNEEAYRSVIYCNIFAYNPVDGMSLLCA